MTLLGRSTAWQKKNFFYIIRIKVGKKNTISKITLLYGRIIELASYSLLPRAAKTWLKETRKQMCRIRGEEKCQFHRINYNYIKKNTILLGSQPKSFFPLGSGTIVPSVLPMKSCGSSSSAGCPAASQRSNANVHNANALLSLHASIKRMRPEVPSFLRNHLM